MVRAPGHHRKKTRTPLHTLLTWKAELGKLKENGPSSNLKRNPPQSDSDWGRFSLQFGTWRILGDRGWMMLTCSSVSLSCPWLGACLGLVWSLAFLVLDLSWLVLGLVLVLVLSGPWLCWCLTCPGLSLACDGKGPWTQSKKRAPP